MEKTTTSTPLGAIIMSRYEQAHLRNESEMILQNNTPEFELFVNTYSNPNFKNDCEKILNEEQILQNQLDSIIIQSNPDLFTESPEYLSQLLNALSLEELFYKLDIAEQMLSNIKSKTSVFKKENEKIKEQIRNLRFKTQK